MVVEREWLSAREAAAVLGVSAEWIRRQNRAGLLGRKFAGTIRVHVSELRPQPVEQRE